MILKTCKISMSQVNYFLDYERILNTEQNVLLLICFFCRGESIIPFKCITGKKGVLYGIQKASYYSPAPGQNWKCY